MMRRRQKTGNGGTIVQDRSLLLVTHVHIRQGPNGPRIDDQTAAGIRQWCRHFDRVTFYGIAVDDVKGGGSTTAWVDTDAGVIDGIARVIPLPWGYGIGSTVRHQAAVRAELRDAIATHRHLCFTLGGIVGDWPSFGAFEAIRAGRRFAAWIDRVEPSIIRNKLQGAPLRRLAAEATLPFTQGAIRHILRRSSVALLQGGDSFDYYARSAGDPHCTYDTHTSVAEQIAPDALIAKQRRISSGAPLRIVYVGRAVAMKGTADWIAVLERLHRAGVPFQATWIGDGPDLPMMKARIADTDMADRIAFPGFEDRRDVLLAALRDSDLLMFCHKTPESARALIEALVCGCPIVGYGSSYPRDLVRERGGGAFAAVHDVAGLAEQVAALHRDRTALADLVAHAAESGTLYSEDTVYADRAALMKRG